MTKSYLDQLTYDIIGAAIKVHSQLGPGLLESIYHKCMKIELAERGISFKTEMTVPIFYNGQELETVLRCDLYVENSVVVELKAAKAIEPIFEAQLLTYMKLLDSPKGILLNFNSTNIFREGQKTFVNEKYRVLHD
ncbi:GxxExxY protein [uncultured Fluviicola sp.]|uniref:GxxExxY protein n=1 Tax=uncultured Fluviicola sp. TaxID=463303 RepID=UPI002600EF11|nr:GxxExxY protein [uncultured Fluviicola sp.]